TVRFYQKLGLIKSASRSAGGYRLFDNEQIRELKFVRHAQELGFSQPTSKNCSRCGKSITLVPTCNPCSSASWRMCTRRSRVLSGWKRSLQGHSEIVIASCV